MAWPNWVEYLAAMVVESRRNVERADIAVWLAEYVGVPIIGLLLAAVGAILFEPIRLWLGIAGLASVVFYLLTLWLIVTPSRVWKEQSEQLRPHFDVEPMKRQDRYPINGGATRAVLVIRNESEGQDLRACTGYLLSVEPDVLNHYHGVYLEWSPHDGGGRQVTIPKQGEATLHVVSAYEGNNTAEVSVYDKGIVYPPLFFNNEHTLVILIASETGASQKKHYRLKIEAGETAIVRMEIEGRQPYNHIISAGPQVTFEESKDL